MIYTILHMSCGDLIALALEEMSDPAAEVFDRLSRPGLNIGEAYLCPECQEVGVITKTWDIAEERFLKKTHHEEK